MIRKKITAVFVLIFFILSTLVSFADIEFQLRNHWAKDLIDREFVKDHFPYLGYQDYSWFTPDGDIATENFMKSLDSLMSKYGVKDKFYNAENFEKYNILTRKDVVKLIIEALMLKRDVKLPIDMKNSFSDINELSNEYIDYILKANRLGIVTGYTDGTFRPDKKISQVQSIILLQRLEGELNMIEKKSVPFKVTEDSKQYSNAKEGITVEEKDNVVLVTITKKFSSSGYNMTVEKVEKLDDKNYNIKIKLDTPNPEMMYLTVITYKSITVRINKEDLGDGEYNFKVDTFGNNIQSESLK